MSPDSRGISPQVLDRAHEGDRDAQAQVLEAYAGTIHRLLFRILGPADDLEDLVQNVMVHLLTSLPRSRRESSFSTWVGSICVHVARDALRRKKVRSVMTSLDAESPGHEAASAERVDEVVAARENLAHCQEALGTLSDSQRVAFVLRNVEGFSVDEVAKMMGAAKSTTRLRLYYGRKAFAKALAQKGLAAPTEGGDD
jgi:RNA polymerase sigma-70 factor (ECF subfamily)